jgi:hypothetical protein
VTEPYGGRAWTSDRSTDRPLPARPPRWATVGVPVVLAALIVVAVVAYLLVLDRESAAPPPSATVPAGSAVPASELEGEWSGEGSLIRCAGVDDGCAETLPITLTIDCPGKVCAVSPFDRSYGSPRLAFADGRYRAAGPVPADVAPTCGGVPTHSALWRLELTVQNGRLAGDYAESTVQGFDCGATGVAWRVVLERS